jgi:hypothetical protein
MMKKMTRNLLIGSLVGATALSASTYEYPQVYKDTRIMGMGGANVALGGEAASIFHNPAGLSGMDPEEGIEFDMIRMTGAFSQNTLSFVGDFLDAQDESAMTALLEKYAGENNHLTVNDYSSLSYRGDSIAWSVGILAGANLNFMTHQGLGSEGLLEINGFVTGAMIAGISYDISDDLHVGLSTKVFQGAAASANLGVVELLEMTDGDPMQYLLDNVMSEFSAVTFDAGVIYDMEDILPLGETLMPSVGVSLQNIGGLELGNYGTVPTMVNVGISFQPDIPFLSDWAFAVDYIDLFNAYYSAADLDKDFGKRLRIGARASLFHNSIIQLTGSTGLYNAAFTAGLEMRLLFFTLEAATYAEEIGAYAGQSLDRRYQLTMNIGF